MEARHRPLRRRLHHVPLPAHRFPNTSDGGPSRPLACLATDAEAYREGLNKALGLSRYRQALAAALL